MAPTAAPSRLWCSWSLPSLGHGWVFMLAPSIRCIRFIFVFGQLATILFPISRVSENRIGSTYRPFFRLQASVCLACVRVFCIRQAAWRAGAITTLEFLLRLPAAGEQGSSVPALLSKAAAALLLTTVLTHPLDVVAARAAADRPRGQNWEWTGAWPSMAYVMLGVPVRFSFFTLPVRCGTSLCTGTRGALGRSRQPPALGPAWHGPPGVMSRPGLMRRFACVEKGRTPP
jgi:hypothetical protein